jgi:hypothetical protein
MFWRCSVSNDPERTATRKAFLSLMLVPGSTFTAMGPGGTVITLDVSEFEELVSSIALITEIEATKHFVTLLSTGSNLAGIIFPDGTTEEIDAISGTLNGFADAMGQKTERLQDQLDVL